MKKEKIIKTHTRRTKSGKTVTVRQHRAKYNAADKSIISSKNARSGKEFENVKNMGMYPENFKTIYIKGSLPKVTIYEKWEKMFGKRLVNAPDTAGYFMSNGNTKGIYYDAVARSETDSVQNPKESVRLKKLAQKDVKKLRKVGYNAILKDWDTSSFGYGYVEIISKK